MHISSTSYYFSSFGPNIFLITLFSNILSLCCTSKLKLASISYCSVYVKTRLFKKMKETFTWMKSKNCKRLPKWLSSPRTELAVYTALKYYPSTYLKILRKIMKISVRLTGLQVKHLTMIFRDIFSPCMGTNEYKYMSCIVHMLATFPEYHKRKGRHQADTICSW
jgi:hypothetical protein